MDEYLFIFQVNLDIDGPRLVSQPPGHQINLDLSHFAHARVCPLPLARKRKPALGPCRPCLPSKSGFPFPLPGPASDLISLPVLFPFPFPSTATMFFFILSSGTRMLRSRCLLPHTLIPFPTAVPCLVHPRSAQRVDEYFYDRNMSSRLSSSILHYTS